MRRGEGSVGLTMHALARLMTPLEELVMPPGRSFGDPGGMSDRSTYSPRSSFLSSIDCSSSSQDIVVICIPVRIEEGVAPEVQARV